MKHIKLFEDMKLYRLIDFKKKNFIESVFNSLHTDLIEVKTLSDSEIEELIKIVDNVYDEAERIKELLKKK